MTEPRRIADEPNVTQAAQWVADHPPRPDIIPEIQRRFELSALQAAQACGLAQKIRVSRKAFQ